MLSRLRNRNFNLIRHCPRSQANGLQRAAAWRSGGFRSTYFQFSTKRHLKTECSI